MRHFQALLVLPSLLLSLATPAMLPRALSDQLLPANKLTNGTTQITNLSIPLRPEQLPPRWHFYLLASPSTIPVLSIYTTILFWVNMIWQFCLGWLEPIPFHTQCDPVTGTCVDFSSNVAIRKVEAAWMVIAMWEKNLKALGQSAERGVWTVRPTRVTYVEHGREKLVGKIGFAVQNQRAWSATAGNGLEEIGRNSTNATILKVGENPWTDRIRTTFYPTQLPSGAGLNVNALGELIVRSMMELCWSHFSDEIPRDRLWVSPEIRGGKLTVWLTGTKVWDVDVTYALVSEGMQMLLKRIGHGFVGEIAGTLGLMNNAMQVQVYAEIGIRMVNGGSGVSSSAVGNIETY